MAFLYLKTGTMAHATVSARAAPSCCPLPPPQPCLCPPLWDGEVAQKGKEDSLTVCGSCLSLRTWHLVCPDSSAHQ